jgi:hypothetical protein
MCFFHHYETNKKLFFPCHFARFIWSIIQVASGMYPPHSVANVFRNWLHGIDICLECLLGWERLPLFGLYGYVEIIKCLIIKTLLSCRSSIGTGILHLWSSLRQVENRDLFMEVCSWLETKARDTFLDMGGSIINGVMPHLLR